MTSSRPVILTRAETRPMPPCTWLPLSMTGGGRAAWWTCPMCGAIGLLGVDETHIDGAGYVTPHALCPESDAGRCHFSDAVRLEGWMESEARV